MQSLIPQLKNIITEKKWTLAVAESCTGGKLGDMITSIPGSSEFFIGGVISYSNQIKSKLLHVPIELLEQKGAVSQQVALSMALGVKKLLKSEVGAAITGIAGPDGGSTFKPVGLVYIAVVTPVESLVNEYFFPGNRAEIKIQAAETAIKLLIEVLSTP